MWDLARLIAVGIAALGMAACSDPDIHPLGDRGGSQYVTVTVPVGPFGVVDPEPAYDTANAHCAEIGRGAVFVRGSDVGDDGRTMIFRCE